MATAGDDTWILPSSIPFERLKGRDLEECVYWLMDSLGARDLEWRTGGSGGGAADGGRDLEAWFYTPAPDGDMEGQRWWIECKGRSATLEPDAVKEACNNALAQADLAYLVIATNTTFSNPTRDWVKQWQAAHPRPKVKLWDQASLERMLSKHPSAVFRLFSHALSTAGLLEVAREGFWNRFDYAPPKSLEAFWKARSELEIGPLERVALTVAEFAHGRIAERPWGVAGTPLETIEALGNAIGNLPYLMGRALRAGIEQAPLIQGIAYLALSSLKHFAADTVAEVILDQLRDGEGAPAPQEVRDLLLGPIFNRLMGELEDVCSSDCPRFGFGERHTFVGGPDPIKDYWERLRPGGRVQPDEGDDDGRRLWIERTTEPCKVGFPMDKDHSCPLFGDAPEVNQLEELLSIIERVADFRFKEAMAKPAKN